MVQLEASCWSQPATALPIVSTRSRRFGPADLLDSTRSSSTARLWLVVLHECRRRVGLAAAENASADYFGVPPDQVSDAAGEVNWISARSRCATRRSGVCMPMRGRRLIWMAVGPAVRPEHEPAM